MLTHGVILRSWQGMMPHPNHYLSRSRSSRAGDHVRRVSSLQKADGNQVSRTKEVVCRRAAQSYVKRANGEHPGRVSAIRRTKTVCLLRFWIRRSTFAVTNNTKGSLCLQSRRIQASPLACIAHLVLPAVGLFAHPCDGNQNGAW